MEKRGQIILVLIVLLIIISFQNNLSGKAWGIPTPFKVTNQSLVNEWMQGCSDCNKENCGSLIRRGYINHYKTAWEQYIINCDNSLCNEENCARKLAFIYPVQGEKIPENKLLVEKGIDIENSIFTDNFIQYYTCDKGELLKEDMQGKTMEGCRDICEITERAKCCQYNEGFSSEEYPEFKIKYSHCFVSSSTAIKESDDVENKVKFYVLLAQ